MSEPTEPAAASKGWPPLLLSYALAGQTRERPPAVNALIVRNTGCLICSGSFSDESFPDLVTYSSEPDADGRFVILGHRGWCPTLSEGPAKAGCLVCGAELTAIDWERGVSPDHLKVVVEPCGHTTTGSEADRQRVVFLQRHRELVGQ